MLVSWSTGPAPSPVTDPPVVRAGAVFQPADLGTQLQARFVGAPATVPTRTFADTPQGIVACAQSVKAYGRVMAVDVGTYAAADAVVLVTSYVPNTDYEEVWVVGPQCGTGSPTVMRHMLMDVDGSTAG
jgi:hypothetical protein